MSQSTQKQPVAPTPHNIKLAWCKANNKKLANLKQEDYSRIIEYALQIGAGLGVQEFIKRTQKSLSEKTPIENEAPAGAEG
jgi:hypothetical protein